MGGVSRFKAAHFRYVSMCTGVLVYPKVCEYVYSCAVAHTRKLLDILAHLFGHTCTPETAHTRTPVHTPAHLCTYSNTFGHTRTPETRGSQHTHTPVHIQVCGCVHWCASVCAGARVCAQLCGYVHRCESMLRAVRLRFASQSKSVRVCAQVCGYVHSCAGKCTGVRVC